MVKVKRTSVGEIANIEPGLYEATLDDVQEVNIPDYGDRLRFVFKIETEDDDEPVYINGLANPVLNERSKLWKWLQAFGVDVESIEVGEEYDLNQLIGKKVMVRVDRRKGKSGGEFSNVTDVLPPSRKKASKKV